MKVIKLRIAACQTPYVHCDIPRSAEVLLSFATQAQSEGADLVCFPECYLQGYLFDKGEAVDLALDLESEEFAEVLNPLAHLDLTIVFGLIEKSGARFHNTAVVVKKGQLIGAYRKTHLLAGESVFSPGADYPIFEVQGVRFGINLCNDLNFPDSAKAVADQGATVLVCPCNNMMGLTNAKHWEPKHNEIRSQRASESKLWLVSSDVTGTFGNRAAYGPTAIIAPDGSILKQVPRLTEGIIYHDFSFEPPIR